MFRSSIAALSLASLALAAVPAAAQTAPATAAPMPKVAQPSDLGCVLRMMDLSKMASGNANNAARTEEQRANSREMAHDARRTLYYFVGKMGPAYSTKNRNAEGEAEFNKMRATGDKELAAEMAMCMREAAGAERALLEAMRAPAGATPAKPATPARN